MYIIVVCKKNLPCVYILSFIHTSMNVICTHNQYFYSSHLWTVYCKSPWDPKYLPVPTMNTNIDSDSVYANLLNISVQD